MIDKIKQNPIILLAIIAVILVAVAIKVATDKTAGTYEDEIADQIEYFTKFRDRINDVTAITMITKGQTFNVELVEGQWILPDRHRYPVSIDKVRDIVLNASELEILEKKTNNPEKHSVLGLDDPQKEDSDAVQITLFSRNGTMLADFIAGKRRLDGGRTFYARNVDDNQTYLVKGEGWLRLDLSPNHWLNSELFRLQKDRVEQVSFKFQTKDKDYTIARAHAGARKFRINDLKNREITSDSDVTDTAFQLQTLTLAGLAPKDFFEFKKKDTTTTIFKTFKGLELTILSAPDEDNDRWIKISAKAEGNGISEETKEEAKLINDNVQDWMYIVTEESSKLLTKKLTELTEVKNDDKK